MSAAWIADDVPSRRFPIYGRGNAGEIYPNVVTPLSASIVAEAAREGQARALLEIGAVVARDLDEPGAAIMSGVFGGYLYLNMSLSRLMGVRAPGMTPGDVDVQMFGTSDAPPYERRRGDRDLAATWRLARFLLRSTRGIDLAPLEAERREVEAWLRDLPEPSVSTDAELLAVVDRAPEWFARHMATLLSVSAQAGAVSALVDRLASRRARVDPGIVLRLTSGIGGIETTAPSLRLWALGRCAADDVTLSQHFDRGVTGVLDRLRADESPAVAAFLNGLSAFVDEFGSRGPDEYETASDTWGTDLDMVLAIVDRLRLTSADADPVAAGRQRAADRQAAHDLVRASLPRPLRRVFDRIMRAAGGASVAREHAKATLVLALHATRVALFELASRARARGGPIERRDFWLVTRGELPAVLADPASFSDTIEQRAKQRDELQARIPPFTFEAPMPAPSTWPLRADVSTVRSAVGDELVGLGVSAGRRRGRVRVILDPSDPGALEPGDVLVAPITDPAWTPLFLAAEAVVVEVGARQSHAAIVARELGIPAVVSVAGATTRLLDGDVVEVDGDRGVIRVVERTERS